MIGFLKSRGSTEALKRQATTPLPPSSQSTAPTAAPLVRPTTAPINPIAAPLVKPTTSPMKGEPTSVGTGPISAATMPHSAIIFFNVQRFFKVSASGERSLIARLFGSTLNLETLCSAMLFTAYVSLVSKNLIRMRVAAATMTGPIIFPIGTPWVKLLSEPLSLYRDKQHSLEGLLMEHLKGRALTSDATQRLIADGIDWLHQFSPPRDTPPPPPQSWDRHYADVLTAPARQYKPVAHELSSTALEQTEALLKQFYAQDEKVATYLSHEINLIMHWLSAQIDEQVRQRYNLLPPKKTNPLSLAQTDFYDERYWQTLNAYARRNFQTPP